jgi:CheY-like chemotaxis protein/anti-sigma regulatory factor (Ser/Thr protein kinase)
MDGKYPNQEVDNKTKLDYHALSHDLKNLLHNILTGIDLLQDQQNKKGIKNNIITSIEKNAQLAIEILYQYEGSHHNLNYEKTSIDLKSILIDAINLIKKNSKISVSFDETVSSQYIYGNQTDIKRILINIINNAQESGKEDVSIKLSLDSIEINRKRLSRIIVEDNGPGIPHDHITKIFDRGFSTKPSKNNSGLGLSIVKEIMDNYNGQIKIDSGNNLGTRFQLLFPYYGESEVTKAVENKKVIIAEDDDFQREILKDLFKSMKFDVYTASNGIETYNLFINVNPDIIFLDDKMPEMTGLECIQKIERVNKATKIVLITGSNIESFEKNEVISRILKKPYRFEMIESIIKELI